MPVPSFVTLDMDWMLEHWRSLEDLCDDPSLAWKGENYLADLPGKWRVSRIGMADGRPLAFAINSIRGRYLWVHRLMVGADHRGASIGHVAIEACQSIVRDEGLNGILVKTPLSNVRALKFYLREGFARLPDSGDHAVLRWDQERAFTVGIHQPNYLPWLGYLYKIYRSDAFIFLDDVPVPKGSYTVRTKVAIGGKEKWLTLPSSRGLNDEVRYSFAAGQGWVRKHLLTLEQNYVKAPYFRDYFPRLSEVIRSHSERDLATLNMALIGEVCDFLGLRRLTYRSSKFGVLSTGDARLVELVQLLGGHAYMSGSGGSNYQSEETFQSAGLGLRYTSFKPTPYPQRSAGFLPGLSVVDALFNCGAPAIMEMFGEAAKSSKCALPA